MKSYLVYLAVEVDEEAHGHNAQGHQLDKKEGKHDIKSQQINVAAPFFILFFYRGTHLAPVDEGAVPRVHPHVRDPQLHPPPRVGPGPGVRRGVGGHHGRLGLEELGHVAGQGERHRRDEVAQQAPPDLAGVVHRLFRV